MTGIPAKDQEAIVSQVADPCTEPLDGGGEDGNNDNENDDDGEEDEGKVL